MIGRCNNEKCVGRIIINSYNLTSAGLISTLIRYRSLYSIGSWLCKRMSNGLDLGICFRFGFITKIPPDILNITFPIWICHDWCKSHLKRMRTGCARIDIQRNCRRTIYYLNFHFIRGGGPCGICHCQTESMHTITVDLHIKSSSFLRTIGCNQLIIQLPFITGDIPIYIATEFIGYLDRVRRTIKHQRIPFRIDFSHRCNIYCMNLFFELDCRVTI